MACVIVPALEAVAVSLVLRRMKRNGTAGSIWRRRLEWLNAMLWGGSFLLMIEHVWHGEIVPWPPFLTAMSNPAETMLMLEEMGTVGVSMAALVTAVWYVAMLLADRAGRASAKTAST
ncbi:MAG: hypothetical protein LBR29_00695 [Methylobacteriaceae bacterium]|jgi:hypothetical protein|nr:hypothetical protein [Methylobacteriaceae bacterium]